MSALAVQLVASLERDFQSVEARLRHTAEGRVARKAQRRRQVKVARRSRRANRSR